ncbi:hypothetical protein OBE_05610, partial [human gut metagenome]
PALVGGGSVLDGTKLIAAGIPYDGDAWELVLDEAKSAKSFRSAT